MSASSIEHSSSTRVRHESELLVEQSSSMPGDESKSTVEHSSLTLCKTTLLVEHPSSTPSESLGFNFDELASVLMDQQPNPKTADKATQAPEKQPYVCFVCGHEVRELANHRQHMLSHHKMDLVGIAVVYDDNPNMKR